MTYVSYSSRKQAVLATLTHELALSHHLSPLQAFGDAQALTEGTALDPAEARRKLLEMASILRDCGPSNTALADTLVLIARTQTFFSHTKYENVKAIVPQAMPSHLKETGCLFYPFKMPF